MTQIAHSLNDLNPATTITWLCSPKVLAWTKKDGISVKSGRRMLWQKANEEGRLSNVWSLSLRSRPFLPSTDCPDCWQEEFANGTYISDSNPWRPKHHANSKTKLHAKKCVKRSSHPPLAREWNPLSLPFFCTCMSLKQFQLNTLDDGNSWVRRSLVVFPKSDMTGRSSH